MTKRVLEMTEMTNEVQEMTKQVLEMNSNTSIGRGIIRAVNDRNTVRLPQCRDINRAV